LVEVRLSDSLAKGSDNASMKNFTFCNFLGAQSKHIRARLEIEARWIPPYPGWVTGK